MKNDNEKKTLNPVRQRGCARTAVGGSVGCRQVGTGLPGLGFEALLAALAVLASGVVLTLALEVPVQQQALGGMEVTLAPERWRQTRGGGHVRNGSARVGSSGRKEVAFEPERQSWFARWIQVSAET